MINVDAGLVPALSANGVCGKAVVPAICGWNNPEQAARALYQEWQS